jgi:preprotein translocase subunit SecG
VIGTENPLTLILIGNSIVLIGLILNQNETTKDSLTKQTSKASSNPFEKITWICLIIELVLLLLKTKITDSY